MFIIARTWRHFLFDSVNGVETMEVEERKRTQLST